jgi:TRAP-type mannitol/chloroaromatic compound transport system permease small subunit
MRQSYNALKAAQLLNSWLDRITQVLLQCSGVMIVLMALVYTYGSLKRYIFLAPDEYAYIGAAALMLFCVVLSLAGVQTLKQHITVDFIGQFFPKKVQEIISDIAGPIFGLVFLIALTYTSWNEAMYALHANQHTIVAATIPTFPFKVVIPIFTGLFTLVIIGQLWLYFASKISHRDNT